MIIEVLDLEEENKDSDKYIYKKTAREKMFTFEEGKAGSQAPEHVSFVSNLRL